jgi:hypothetical protein
MTILTIRAATCKIPRKKAQAAKSRVACGRMPSGDAQKWQCRQAPEPQVPRFPELPRVLSCRGAAFLHQTGQNQSKPPSVLFALPVTIVCGLLISIASTDGNAYHAPSPRLQESAPIGSVRCRLSVLTRCLRMLRFRRKPESTTIPSSCTVPLASGQSCRTSPVSTSTPGWCSRWPSAGRQRLRSHRRLRSVAFALTYSAACSTFGLASPVNVT